MIMITAAGTRMYKAILHCLNGFLLSPVNENKKKLKVV